ncbi:MAG TPA: hypothetical protein VKV19_10870 [Ktedonobacteraceae bacterium]|jgi:hypothetical protein|nr:hypothetical protein [Ktedonobacteraceae bacterium]
MRGKLRDKRDLKRDRFKRETMVRKPSKRENRNLQFLRPLEDDDYLLDEDGELSVSDKQQN